MRHKDGGKIIHGNKAKINPGKHVESLFKSNPVTAAEKIVDGVPVPSQQDVEYARNFDIENKK